MVTDRPKRAIAISKRLLLGCCVTIPFLHSTALILAQADPFGLIFQAEIDLPFINPQPAITGRDNANDAPRAQP
jgi:hypothetical protein